MKKLHLKIWHNNGKIKDYFATKFIRRILATVSLAQFKKAYVRVSYGKKIDNYGKLSEFDNEGIYTDKKELSEVIKDFWAED